MRLMIVPRVVLATPATAAPDTIGLEQALRDPATAERIDRSLGALTDALLDLKVGGVKAALEGRKASPSEQALTVRDFERQEGRDPEAIRRQVREAGPALTKGMNALAEAIPAMTRAMGAIEKAIEGNRRGRRVRGASTISQQVAKNLFLTPDRNFVRKGLEAWFTVLIEFLWPKKRILEVHLNIAEFGPGVFGVTAASRRYFDKEPAALSPREAALLAAVLPSPKRLKADRPSAYVQRRVEWILGQMSQLGGAGYLDGM